MGRTTRASVMLLPVALLLFLAACTSGRRVQPPPVFDPHKEQISILQKQLLELQNQQNETRRKVDEQAAAMNALDSRVSAVESQRTAPRTMQPPAAAAAAESVNETASKRAPAAKEKTVKKRPSKRKKTR